MTKLSNEIKIAEKLKFWEEQDAINQELIPRVIKNHEMITLLTAQNEQAQNILATTQEELIRLKSEKQADRLKINDFERKIDEVTAQLAALEKRIQHCEETIQHQSSSTPKQSSQRDKLLFICTLFAMTLSIVSFLL